MKITPQSNIDFTGQNFDQQFKNFLGTINDENLGFFHLTDKTELIDDVARVYLKIKNKKNFVQVGIGGSALGPEMLVDALAKNEKNFLCLDNVDPDYIHRKLNSIDLKDSIFYVVSKSGGTAETIACYSIIRNELSKVGIEDFENYFIFCTDPEAGELRAHVEKHQYTSLSVPANIGGRFSVLSAVGLLPAMFMGIDCKKLFEGANSAKSMMLSKDFNSNSLFQTAELIYQASLNGVNQTVMMPYSSLLKSFSAWFVQLWAESLGKIGPTGPVGLTPIAAYGATDQHSQVQLFMEGPNDKVLFLIHIAQSEHDYQLDSGLELSRAVKLAPYKMSQLLEAEFQGNMQALKEQNRSLVEIELKKLDESSMGAMIMFFESLTAVMGNYLEIDAFNQPGVEKGKVFTFQFLASQQS